MTAKGGCSLPRIKQIDNADKRTTAKGLSLRVTVGGYRNTNIGGHQNVTITH